MPLPSIIQASTDSFNHWLDATNNVISHIANTSVFVTLSQNATPVVSTGNVALSGTLTLPVLVVNSLANIAGTTINVSANLNHTGTAAVFTSNVTVSAATLSVGGNTTMSGTFVNVSSGRLAVTGNVSFSNSMVCVGNVAFSNTLVVTGATSVYGTVTMNNTVTLANTLSVVGASTFTGASEHRGTLVTNSTVTLSGPLEWAPGFVLAPTALSGAGTQHDLANNISGYSNTVVYRLSSDQNKNVSGLHIADATKYRQIVIINTGNFDITLLHDNAGSIANNRILTPSNLAFVLAKGGAVTMVFDANTSSQRWRVVAPGSTAVVEANTTVAGVVSTGTQSFAGDKTFTGLVSANGVNLTSLNATSLTTGTVPNDRLSGTYTLVTSNNSTFAYGKTEGNLNVNSATSATSATTATQATNATNLNSQTGAFYTNATNINAGTIGSAYLPSANTTANGAVNTAAQTFAGAKTFNNLVTANGITLVAGAALTANGGVGTAGHVLKSNGSSAYWAASSMGTGGTDYVQPNVITTGVIIAQASNSTSSGFRLTQGVEVGVGSRVVGDMWLEGDDRIHYYANGVERVLLLTAGDYITANVTVAAATFTTTGGAAAGTTFDGSTARTIDYSTVGAPKTDGTGATGTWPISVSGNAGSADTASVADAVAWNDVTGKPTIDAAYVGAPTTTGGGGTGTWDIDITGVSAGAPWGGITSVPGCLVSFIDSGCDVTDPSDARLKNIQGPITSALSRVNALRGVFFTWNEIGKSFVGECKSCDEVQSGVIAQDVQAVFPEVVKPGRVSESGEVYLSVAYDKLVPLLIEAVKELSAEVDKLRGTPTPVLTTTSRVASTTTETPTPVIAPKTPRRGRRS